MAILTSEVHKSNDLLEHEASAGVQVGSVTGTGSILSFIYSGNQTSNRLLQIKWLPRWMAPHYDTESPLAKLYYSCVFLPVEALKDRLLSFTTPDFYGIEGLARQSFVIRYPAIEDHIPTIEISTDDPSGFSGSPKRVYTDGDLIYEPIDPVFFYTGRDIVIRNVGVVRADNISSFAGEMDLTAVFTSYPILEDSIIHITDDYGDSFIIDQTDPKFNDNKILLHRDGLYTVRYISSKLNDEFLTGKHQIKIGEFVVSLEEKDLINLWDEYAARVGIVRRKGESNRTLKARCQKLSILADKNIEGIGAALHKSQFFFWDTHSASLSVSASGFTFATGWGVDKETTISRESVPLRSGAFILTSVPCGYVQLFERGSSIPVETYSVTGSVVLFKIPKFTRYISEGIFADYITLNYATTENSSAIQTLTRYNLPIDLFTFIGTKHIKARTTRKTELSWRWNVELDIRAGLATFN